MCRDKWQRNSSISYERQAVCNKTCASVPDRYMTASHV
jgi:hypothetical protein